MMSELKSLNSEGEPHVVWSIFPNSKDTFVAVAIDPLDEVIRFRLDQMYKEKLESFLNL